MKAPNLSVDEVEFMADIFSAKPAATSAPSVYGARTLKRFRSTKAQMEAFRARLFELVEGAQPCTVRHVYYLAVTDDLIEKDHGQNRANYNRIVKVLADMRETGLLPWDWIRDDTRFRRTGGQWRNSRQALQTIQERYRRDLWQSQPNYVEVWCESDSLAGVLWDTTAEFGVDLLPCRGQSSKTFARSAAYQWKGDARDITVIYVGDFDPDGLLISRSLQERLWRYGAEFGLEPNFHRLAVTGDQARELGLTGHDLNPNSKGLGDFSGTCERAGIPLEAVEAEAIPPAAMRGMLREEIEGYIDAELWHREQAIEKAERDSLADILDKLP